MEKIGKYDVQRLLGRGAMGAVYEAFDPDIERRVAIKTLHAHLFDREETQDFFERFRREAKAAARCVHHNIVAILEYGKQDGVPYLVMEYAEGVPLDQIIKTGQTVSYRMLFSVMGQLLSALNVAHAESVVHRDIKPANIIILHDGTPKLTDFGIARLSSESDLTRTGMAVGTPRFMPPEQFYGHDLDGRADLFALTMVMLDMLANLPDDERVPMAPMPMLTGLPGNNRIDGDRYVPAALVPVIRQGLAAEPDARFADARAMVEALRAAMHRLTEASGGVDRAEVLQQRQSAKAKSGRDAARQLHDAQTAYETQIGRVPSDDDSSGSLSGLTGATRTSDNRSGVLFAGFAANIDEDTLTGLKSDLVGHIGPQANRMVQQELEDAISFAEMVHALANHIPDARKRARFIDRWSG